ncbi:MAG: long-chain fatty acid--CoA ligase [Alphaproteobacteria bacterium]|nr:long-chain fatty acid--CoA ligase [Alphaproteobacteria bacterium]
MNGATSSTPRFPWLKNYPSFAPWDAPLPVVPAFAGFLNAVRNYPENVCLEFMGNFWTYAEVGHMAARAAKGLQDLGVTKGARVALMLPNTLYYVAVYMGTLMAGATVVNVNPLYAERELEHLVKDSGADILITLDLGSMYPKAHKILTSTKLKKLIVCSMADALPWRSGVLFSVFKRGSVAKIDDAPNIMWFDDLLSNRGDYVKPAIDCHNDVAVLQYTGGTTGVPKAAMLSHANVAANTHQVARWHKNPVLGEERFLAAIPFFHVFAMTVAMLSAFEYGAAIIMMPRFDLKDCLKTIHKRKPTCFPAVPTIFMAINNAPDVANYDLTSIKLCISGGAPLPVEAKKEFERITGCVLVEGYGLSETSPVVCTNPTEGENKAGSIGLPMPGTIVEIRSLDTGDPVPIGERGELCVRGPQVMMGYWNKPDETANVLKDGLLRTGDVAIMDDQGYFFIVDRIKDMINCSGYKVYPRVVEEAIHLHPAVAETTVIGIDDKYRGQAPKAFVKLKAGTKLTQDELLVFLKDKLSPMERPAEIEFRDVLPKTLIGKLSKKELKEEEKSKSGGATA